MYVTIRRYTGVDFPDEAAQRVRNEFLPIISKIKGFQEYYAIRDGNDAVISISVFANKPGADASVKSAASWVKDNLSEYLPNPPQVMGGEAMAHTHAGEAKSVA